MRPGQRVGQSQASIRLRHQRSTESNESKGRHSREIYNRTIKQASTDYHTAVKKKRKEALRTRESSKPGLSAPGFINTMTQHNTTRVLGLEGEQRERT